MSADATLLTQLLAAGRTPVVASLACDAEGTLLNVNADDAAAALAVAIKASDLMLLSDAPGLKLAGELVPHLSSRDLPAALERPEVEGGMRPKLRAAQSALQGGVTRVHISAWSGTDTLAGLLAGKSCGTTFFTPTAEAAHGQH